ncbi:hypothetical protein [Leyella stercorea]|uniref:hypothetical protein n=1 Tax=Leyella stercorea TaxID=363265 RepID=UPI00242E60C6|nr:hypothetical protein [Leyella stercorea]
MLSYGDTHRSTQTSATVDADIRNGRRRHPHRSTQTSATVDASQNSNTYNPKR